MLNIVYERADLIQQSLIFLAAHYIFKVPIYGNIGLLLMTFPFYGMPQWAQYLGNVLPLTHFLRIVRGIFLKGNGFVECQPDLNRILMFLGVVTIIGVMRYRQTLD